MDKLLAHVKVNYLESIEAEVERIGNECFFCGMIKGSCLFAWKPEKELVLADRQKY